jgi:hypothetical protein
MNQLSTIASIIAKMDPMAKQATKGAELDNILNAVKLTIKDEPNIDITAAWAENNLTYLDFRFAIAPRWAIEGHEVKMSLSVSTDEQSWYVNMVVDCQDGELESWGHLDMNPQELEPLSCPVNHMLSLIKEQYDSKRKESSGKYIDQLKMAKIDLEPLADKIRDMCKEHKVKLWFDRNLDGSNSLMVLPEDAYTDESGEKIDTDNVPYLDMGIVGFDSNYDHPRLPS